MLCSEPNSLVQNAASQTLGCETRVMQLLKMHEADLEVSPTTSSSQFGLFMKLSGNEVPGSRVKPDEIEGF